MKVGEWGRPGSDQPPRGVSRPPVGGPRRETRLLWVGWAGGGEGRGCGSPTGDLGCFPECWCEQGREPSRSGSGGSLAPVWVRTGLKGEEASQEPVAAVQAGGDGGFISAPVMKGGSPAWWLIG